MELAYSRLNHMIDFATRTELRIVTTFTFLLLISDRILYYLLLLFTGSVDLGTPFYFDLNIIDQLFLTVIIGPIFETVIFHFILIELLLYLFRRNQFCNYFVIIISALLFSASHYYSFDYLIIAFTGGVILSTAYIVAKFRNMLPFAIVFLIHVTYNLISLLYYGLKNGMLF